MKSKKTLNKPIWLKYTKEEVEDIILSIADKNQGITSEKIGLILRDSYGIPKTKIYGIKISEVLKEKGKYENADLKNISKKVEKLEKHILKHKKDQKTFRSLIISKAKLKKTNDYLAKKYRQ